MNLRRIASGAAYWGAAPALIFALYWRGLFAWFQKDDFAWLGLRDLIHQDQTIWWALFQPLAQGTIRTLSERVVYLSFVSIFGLEAFPFRCLAFITCIAAASMLSAVAAKLTGSRAVGFWASILWICNIALAAPMVWQAVYYELAWPLCLLTMMWLLIRYVETGERRFFIAQVVLFVAGFFILEVDVVYPAIAAAYAILSPEARKRGLLKKVLPLFLLSIAYTIVHFSVAPLQKGGPYQLFWDTKIFTTLTTYWSWALGPGQGRLIHIVSTLARSIPTWALTIGLFFFACRNRSAMVWFFPAWFLIALAPLLPLRNHIDPEYLTAPTLGLAMWGAWAVVSAWRANWIARIGALILFAIYMGFSITIGQTQVRRWSDDSHQVRRIVMTIADAAHANSGKVVLLKRVDSKPLEEMIEEILYDRALRLYRVNEIHLLPEGEEAQRENRAIVIDLQALAP